ncbi:LacI family transcriptional regulator [Calidifontibacter sp. DB0510]|uniref:LacI family transcriptional regulator n=1 Tax=Metallococcus carri TaxID=1656884 RepID=A0A967B9G8_9MICO|nr:LacI family DNA-binding transcriptional regulator [Metallococcus carri]NHN57311.1 LacI family transcriptional regulator [Metallococcus carri]NOP38084.1 LacI family DNA-binding transcriptional regulator [Calidifontibacter sp. DB2511S]
MAPRDTAAVTIYQVAQRAGVSIATVSRVLKKPDVVSPDTRDRVQRAIDELDYLPDGSARSLAARRQETHGLILPELTGAYFAELLAGYESAAAALDQSVMVVLAADKDDIARAARRLATHVDGIAVMGSAGLPDDLVLSLSGRIPVVVVAGAEQPGIEVVRAENTVPARELTGRLLDAGRRSLRFVGDPEAAVDVAHRYAGFVAAHRDRGLEPAPAMVAKFTEEAGVKVAAQLLESSDRPDGLVCANDLLAIVLIDRLQTAGVNVPTDLAITGWDDILAARYLRPRLTSVRQPVRQLAAYAADRLHSRITGDVSDADWGRTHVLPADVVIRDSCGTALPHKEGNLR